MASDKLHLLSRLSLRRGFNALKLFSGFYYSRLTRTPHPWGMPISIAIEPTTSCNLRCPECPSGKREFTRATGMLDQTFFRKTIDEVAKDILYLTFYFQGEPYLNPGFLDMVKYACQKRIYTATSTNAHYLDDENARRTVESGLARLIISIDGTTQETYEQYRVGGELNKVLEGTKNLLRWKKRLGSKTPHVIFQFLVVRPNEHQVEDVKRMAEEMGVNEVLFKTAQLYDHKNGHELMPENEKYSRYRKNANGTWSIKNKMEDHCKRMWQSCVITWDGKVVPCCFDKDAKYQLGALKETSFRSIWFSDDYNKFRGTILRSRSEIDICANCSEGTAVFSET